MKTIAGNARPLLIGSLPVEDHDEALALVLRYTPEIPSWAQLPRHGIEKMIPQFMPGMPGGVLTEDKAYVDTAAADFEEALLAFYQDYVDVAEGGADADASRFRLTPETAPGFFTLADWLGRAETPPGLVKGQVTGPITFCTGLKDQDGRAILFDDQLKDAAVKLLALKAAWQVRKLAAEGRDVIVFIDEPALAGFGSSELISVSREDVRACLDEVVEAIHGEGGLAGIHVCANTDWSLILESALDVVNFDAYAYFDRFILYDQALRSYLDSGRILAWGLVPTLNAEDIAREDADSLKAQWDRQVQGLAGLGISEETVVARSLITPSCGMGALSRDQALKVLETTRALADKIAGGP